MNPEAILPSLLFVVVFILGVDATHWLWQNYRAIAPTLNPRARAIGFAFVVVSVAIVVVVGWLGFLSVRRLLGFEALEWSFIVSYALSIPVLLIPVYLKRVWQRIGRP